MSKPPPTLLLSRSAIAALASSRDYLNAMHDAFAGLSDGRYVVPDVGHVPAESGAFHIKSAVRSDRHALAAIKINGNFPGNPAAWGLPTIQGILVLLDAERGSVLALMDSVEITARRTAAATALAARHLARPGARCLGIVGCGVQAAYHLEALLDVAPLESVRFCDLRDEAAQTFEQSVLARGLEAIRAADPRDAARGADLIVTVTTSTSPLLGTADVADGAFVAGVGADNPAKHELAPDLLRESRVVVDSRSQAVASGDLGHAVRRGTMTQGDIYAELAEIVSARKPGRTSADERYVFDSTGLAVQDLAAAEMLVERARAAGGAASMVFNDPIGLDGTAAD